MNELTRWKKELESTLQDYVQNPCIKTADAMLRTALAFKSDNAVHQPGIKGVVLLLIGLWSAVHPLLPYPTLNSDRAAYSLCGLYVIVSCLIELLSASETSAADSRAAQSKQKP